MLGKPRAAQFWNRRYATVNGAKIEQILLSFHEQTLDLAPAMPNLDVKIAKALRGLGIEPEEYAVLSLKKFSSSMAAALPRKRHELANELQDDLVAAMEQSFCQLLLKKKYYPQSCGGEGMAQLHKDLMLSVGPAISTNFDRIFEKHLCPAIKGDMREDVYSALCGCAEENLSDPLFYQIAFLATGRFEEAERIGNVLEFFKQGNFPCGMTAGGVFFILTA